MFFIENLLRLMRGKPRLVLGRKGEFRITYINGPIKYYPLLFVKDNENYDIPNKNAFIVRVDKEIFVCPGLQLTSSELYELMVNDRIHYCRYMYEEGSDEDDEPVCVTRWFKF